MHSFIATIHRHTGQGEKMGWTYVEIPHDILQKLQLPDKKGFRIKGKMDDVAFEKLSTYPVGEGNFIIAINAELKRKLGKKKGATVRIAFEKDTSGALKSPELLEALNEDKAAQKQFFSMPESQQNYFHRYIESAKGAATKADRIVHTMDAMHRKLDFGAMIRGLKKSAQ